MGSPRNIPPTPVVGHIISKFGHTFVWTKRHQTALENYTQRKTQVDSLGETCAQILAEWPIAKGSKRDVYALFQAHHAENEHLQKLWAQVTTVPEWANWDQISRGQDVFNRYATAMIMALTLQSLMGNVGGRSGPAEVLARTGGFSMEKSRKRTLETAQLAVHVTQGLESIKPEGEGFATALGVRFLHARVRARILKLAAVKPDYYSAEEHDIPINDADCVSTIAAFACVPIWLALPRQGLRLSERERADYVALWRLVAYYMGTPVEDFADNESAKTIMEVVYAYEYHPSETSKLLARNILRAMEYQPPGFTSRALLETLARRLNGDELSDVLGLPLPSLYYRTLTAGYCNMLTVLTNFTRAVPVLDRYVIAHYRKTYHNVVFGSKNKGLDQVAVYDLQYVPEVGKKVENEADREEWRPKVFWTGDRMALVALTTPVMLLIGIMALVFKGPITGRILSFGQ